MDDTPEVGDVLLMQNILMSEILILYANYFNDVKGFNLSRSNMSKVRFKDIFLLLVSWQCLFEDQRLVNGNLLALISFGSSRGLFSLHLDLHQPSILFRVVGGRRRHDGWPNRSDRK